VFFKGFCFFFFFIYISAGQGLFFVKYFFVDGGGGGGLGLNMVGVVKGATQKKTHACVREPVEMCVCAGKNPPRLC